MPNIPHVGFQNLKLPRPSIPYSLRMLGRDGRRFLPALTAIGLSAVLIAVQCGLVMGLVLTTSAPIDHCRAQIWVLPLEAPSLHQTYQFPLAWQSRLDLQPEIDRSENYLTGMGRWRLSQRGKTELCMLIGMRLDSDSLGALNVLTPELRAALAEPGTVAVDAWEFDALGLKGDRYEAAEINGQPVRLAAILHGFHGFSFTYVFCSQDTLRLLEPRTMDHPELATCLVAHCRDPGRGPRGRPAAPRLSGHGRVFKWPTLAPGPRVLVVSFPGRNGVDQHPGAGPAGRPGCHE